MRILFKVAATIVAALLCATLALQLPGVQTALSKAVAGELSKRCEADIEISRINFLPFNTLIVKDFTVIDRTQCAQGADTVFHVGRVMAKFSLQSLLSGGTMRLRSAEVKNSHMTLVNEAEGVSNLDKVFPPEDEPTPMYMMGNIIRVDNIDIENFTFRLINLVPVGYD